MLVINECFQNCQSCKYFRHIQIANCLHICFPMYWLWFAINYNQTASKKHWQPSYGCYLTWCYSKIGSLMQEKVTTTLLCKFQSVLHFESLGWKTPWKACILGLRVYLQTRACCMWFEKRQMPLSLGFVVKLFEIISEMHCKRMKTFSDVVAEWNLSFSRKNANKK